MHYKCLASKDGSIEINNRVTIEISKQEILSWSVVRADGRTQR